MVVLVATSLAFDTTFFSILSVDPALAGLSLMLPAPDLAVGEFSFFVTELLVFTVVLRVASSAAGLDFDTDLAVAVFLAKDFTTGLGLGLATLGNAFDAVAVGVSVLRSALAESFRVFSTAFSVVAALLEGTLALPAAWALLDAVNLSSAAGACLATVFLTVRFMVLSLAACRDPD
ncbi:hypothetical protein ACIPF8_14295 [Collimonas sp. NPDC087041]|uniref:hypothetical protein n=1 Tax=Collimonas TaxID=202907 RepID=UPI0012E781C9|nr:hypothetical protein [Collimonas arenae]